MNSLKAKTRKIISAISYVLLLFIITTTVLPKELFDDHPGIDTDIFCRFMTVFGSAVLGDSYIFIPPHVHCFIVLYYYIVNKLVFISFTISPRAPPSI